MMHHLASTQYSTALAVGDTGRLFLKFGGLIWADRISNFPLDRVLTLKFNLFTKFANYVFCVADC